MQCLFLVTKFLVDIIVSNWWTESRACRSRNKGAGSPNTWIFAGSCDWISKVQSNTVDLFSHLLWSPYV